MGDIQILARYHSGIDANRLKTYIIREDFSDELFVAEKDKQIIEENWEELLEESGGKVFSRAKARGTLYETAQGKSAWKTTDFKTYVAVSRTHKAKTLSAEFYRDMRVSAVGGVVISSDDKVLVQKRSAEATHVPNSWDSSVAGRADLKDGGIDIRGAVYGALGRELKITEEETEEVKVTGLHSARDPDFSGMFSFKARVNLHSSELRCRASEKDFEDFIIEPVKDLPEILEKVFVDREQTCLDGCATLLASIPSQDYPESLDFLRGLGYDIQFGRLNRGVFLNAS